MLSDNKNHIETIEPPPYLDGAKVLYWAWSGQEPYGFVELSDHSAKLALYGIALCQYANEKMVYRFSCDKNWVVVQDSVYDSVVEAIDRLPEQYKKEKINWQKT